ncbi:MAG: hypothetical protein IT392_00855 [Nitrospirae bacterium]|nr:hypothetical protein [Nitrospirota bacterium]
MLEHLLRGSQIIRGESPDILARKIARLTDEISGAEMKEFFTTALKLAVENKCIDENDRVILSYEIFKKTREKMGAGQRRLAGFGR